MISSREKGKTAVKYELPQLKEILDETYGVLLYQEQVMQIANKLANFTMGQADILRKATGKKTGGDGKLKEAFINGAVANKISEKKATRLVDLWLYLLSTVSINPIQLLMHISHTIQHTSRRISC